MQDVVYNICGEEKSLLFAEAWGWTFSELGQNIKWVKELIEIEAYLATYFVSRRQL